MAALDLTIKAQKVAQTDLEKKLGEAKANIVQHEAHSIHFAEACSGKDSLVEKLESKLKEQDAQWEKDIQSLSAQMAIEKSTLECVEAKLQEALNHGKQMSVDLEGLRKQHGHLSEEKEALNHRLHDVSATCEALEKKLQEKRDLGNEFEAAMRKQDEEIADLKQQVQFYTHEAAVASEEAKKWGTGTQTLESNLAAEKEKCASLYSQCEIQKSSNAQLLAQVATLTSELDKSAKSLAKEREQSESATKKLEEQMTALKQQCEQELAEKQQSDSELKNTKRQLSSLEKDLANESADKAKLQEKEAKTAAALQKSESERSKEKEHAEFYKHELKKAADEQMLLKVKYDDEIVSRKKMEKGRDEYLSKVNILSEKLKKETSAAEQMTGQVKVLSKANLVLETDVTRLTVQVEKLEGELKSQKQLRLNAESSVSSLTEAQKKLQQELQKLKDAKSKLEAAAESTLRGLDSATSERNAVDQRYQKTVKELKELQTLVAKEQGLKSQLRAKSEETASKLEELEATHTTLQGEKKNLTAELNMSRKLITDLEQKIKEQDGQWSDDVALLKGKLSKAKTEWTKLHDEAAQMRQKMTDLEAEIEKIRAENSTLTKDNLQLQAAVESSKQVAESARKAAEAAIAAKKTSTEAAEASRAEKEAAVAKGQASERQRAEMQKEKELTEHRLEAARQELDSNKKAVKKEQENVKSTEIARDDALSQGAKLESQLRAMMEQKSNADAACAKLKTRLSELERALEKSKAECKNLNESLSREEAEVVALNVQLAERKSAVELLETKVTAQDRQWEDDVSKLRKTLQEQQKGYSELKTLHASSEAAHEKLQVKVHQQQQALTSAHNELSEHQRAQEVVNTKLKSLNADVDILQSKLKSEIEKSDLLRGHLSQERDAKKASDNAYAKQGSDMKARINTLLDSNTMLESKLRAQEEAQKDLERQVQDEIIAKTKAHQELEREGKEIERLNGELELEQQQVLKLQDLIVGLKEQAERNQLEAEDEAKKLHDITQKLEHTAAELQRKGQTICSLDEKVKRLEIELRDTAAEAAKQAAVLARTKQENQRMDVQVETLTTKGKKLQAEYDTVLKRVVEIDRKLLLSQENLAAEQKNSMEKSKTIAFFEDELKAAKLEIEKLSLQNAELQKWKTLYLKVQQLSLASISNTKTLLVRESSRFQGICLDLAGSVEQLQQEVKAIHNKLGKSTDLNRRYQEDLQTKNSELEQTNSRLHVAMDHIREYRTQIEQLESSLKNTTRRESELDAQLRDMESLNEELSRQKKVLANALDAEKTTLLGYIKMLQAAGNAFFPDPVPQRCHLNIPDRVWLITIEFRDNSKVLGDLLHQTYIEEDFSKGQAHMTALPGGLTKSKVDSFKKVLRDKLENHASSKTGLDRSALEELGKCIWLELNPKEVDRVDQQAKALADAMLAGVAPESTFAVVKLDAWLDSITYVLDSSQGDLVMQSQHDRRILTTDVDDFDRVALWIHCCSLMDYIIQSCGRSIANLSTEELRLLQLTHFLKRRNEKDRAPGDDDDHVPRDQRDSGNEYWKRDSDSTYSQGSFVDRFRMSWEYFQKTSVVGISAPTTPRSHFSVNTISVPAQNNNKINNSDGRITPRGRPWFMADPLFEA